MVKDAGNRPHDAVLELLQLPSGEVVLRPQGQAQAEPLVRIQFSAQVQHILGDQVHAISQTMVQAALLALAEQQMARWHAQVLDEAAAHYS